MKTNIMRLSGGKSAEITLPQQFMEPVRPDLVKRAVSSLQMSRRQPYGADPLAGKRQGYTTVKRRKKFKTTYGKGVSRIRRKHLWSRGSQFYWIGAFVANAVGGRKAFPPKADKNLIERINKKERRKAIRSAISGSKYMILDDSFEKLNKSKDVINSLLKNDLKSELERLENKKIRAGRGTTRGRKYITKKGPLVIVSDMCPAVLATENLQGFDVSVVNNLNAELLAPGGDIGRRTIWTKSAVEKLEKEKLFLWKTFIKS